MVTIRDPIAHFYKAQKIAHCKKFGKFFRLISHNEMHADNVGQPT
jgi:hypothetical protein